MAGTVSFKVYMSLENDLSKNEVRRFGVEVDVVTNFLYLREKIQSIFPALRGKNFTISWKDSDGDYVIISSDEELGIALTETASNDIRKLYVVLHPEYEMRSEFEPQGISVGPHHVGITCDGCDKPVHGFRYKCIQCADYDLCVKCEGRGMHPEHCMIRLSVPLQWKPHYGRRLANQVNKFVKKAHCHTTKEEEQKQCPYKSGKHHGKSRHGGLAGEGGVGSSWVDTFATFLDEWANIPGECPMKETAKEAKEETKEAEPKTPRANDYNPSEQIKLLKNAGLAVGENFLSQFLDPLVNMHNMMEKPTPSAAPAAASSTPSASTSPDKEKPVESPKNEAPPKFPGEGKKLRETVADEASAKEQPKQPEEKISAEKVCVENEPGWTLLNRGESPTPSVSSPSTGAVPKQVQPSAPVEAPSKPIYSTLPPPPVVQPEPKTVPVYHANPTIQNAVETMRQMGFSNEGGWLTNLLVSKSGDIAAALDALSPVRR